MSDLNKVILIGRIVADPELNYVAESNTAKTRMRLAVNRKYKNAAGEVKEDPTFVTITVWGKQAENCATYLKRGSQVCVEGRLRIYQYGEETEKKNATEVVAENVVFLGGAKSSAETHAAVVEDVEVPF